MAKCVDTSLMLPSLFFQTLLWNSRSDVSCSASSPQNVCCIVCFKHCRNTLLKRLGLGSW